MTKCSTFGLQSIDENNYGYGEYGEEQESTPLQSPTRRETNSSNMVQNAIVSSSYLFPSHVALSPNRKAVASGKRKIFSHYDVSSTMVCFIFRKQIPELYDYLFFIIVADILDFTLLLFVGPIFSYEQSRLRGDMIGGGQQPNPCNHELFVDATNESSNLYIIYRSKEWN